MPWRDITKIKTLGDLRKVVNEDLKDLEDDYEIDILTNEPIDFSSCIDLDNGVDISYSNKAFMFYANEKK